MSSFLDCELINIYLVTFIAFSYLNALINSLFLINLWADFWCAYYLPLHHRLDTISIVWILYSIHLLLFKQNFWYLNRTQISSQTQIRISLQPQRFFKYWIHCRVPLSWWGRCHYSFLLNTTVGNSLGSMLSFYCFLIDSHIHSGAQSYLLSNTFYSYF